MEMILSFVKIDVSAAICKMTEIYIYIYIYIYEHEATRIPKSENNIGAPSAPQKEAKKKKELDDKASGEEMRHAAMERLSSKLSRCRLVF